MMRSRNKYCLEIPLDKPFLSGSMAGTARELGDIITPDPTVWEGALDKGELEELYGSPLLPPRSES